MLKIPQLDDLTYEQMINRAIARIPTMTDQWTDFNSHDPGITVLQTYAWLVDMLNYYMNATGDVHVQKYLKLLGIEPQPARASEGYVILENINETTALSKGTCFYAGGIPFELENDCNYVPNSFCSYVQESDGMAMDLTAFAGSDGDFAEAFAEDFCKKSSLYLGFEKPLFDGDKLYISVKEDGKRNPFGADFQLCPLKWEIYTEDGWKKLSVKDGTCGFLKSGFVEVHFTEPMKSWNHPEIGTQAYYIRCILKENKYDSMPQLGKIYVNPLKIIQRRTICPQGELREELKIGKTNGCADQKLLFDYPDTYRFSLALKEADSENYELWTMTDHLEEADYKEQKFFFNREEKLICFGDGIHGMVPEQGQHIFVTGLECSMFENGNVLAGEIRGTDCEKIKECRIYNPTASVGGRMQESMKDMMKRLEDTLFVQNRMAAETDYEQIVLNTPGLMLELAHVIPGKVYGQLYRQDRSMNEIMVVVKPYGKDHRTKLSKAYQKMIEQYIEKYRLINTKVSIVSPAYVGVEVHGKLRLSQDTPRARERVYEKIEKLVSYQGKEKPFGTVISYGELFTSLESMEEVRMVIELSLQKNGTAAVKNERGDILCQADALSYVEKLNLEFC